MSYDSEQVLHEYQKAVKEAKNRIQKKIDDIQQLLEPFKTKKYITVQEKTDQSRYGGIDWGLKYALQMLAEVRL